ncbi:MAG: patatin-like phospholipase family protein [Clostridiales bacterium]|nr:patatin-like phospholipase family protein [Clostridiales bacterium]
MSGKIKKARPKIGLALGGGGVRGSAHVGVLNVLEEYGVEIDMLAGTSAGSAVAALYAFGYSPQSLQEILGSLNLREILRLSPGRMGLISSRGYAELIRKHTNNGLIEQAAKKLFIVSVDLISQKEFVFTSGEVAPAVQASSSLPGLMPPLRHQGMLLADGGILNNCPARCLYDAGADVVLAVNLSCLAEYEPKNTVDVLFRSMDIIANNNSGQADADWVVNPITEPIGVLDRHMLERARQLGEEAARREIGRLLELLASYESG